MALNPDLLKPFVKVSIQDLALNIVDKMQMVWIQGTVTLIKEDFIELSGPTAGEF